MLFAWRLRLAECLQLARAGSHLKRGVSPRSRLIVAGSSMAAADLFEYLLETADTVDVVLGVTEGTRRRLESVQDTRVQGFCGAVDSLRTSEAGSLVVRQSAEDGETRRCHPKVLHVEDPEVPLVAVASEASDPPSIIGLSASCDMHVPVNEKLRVHSVPDFAHARA